MHVIIIYCLLGNTYRSITLDIGHILSHILHFSTGWTQFFHVFESKFRMGTEFLELVPVLSENVAATTICNQL